MSFYILQPTTAELDAVWEEDTVKRICICGSPPNLQVVLRGDFLHDFRQVNRMDLYELHGPLMVEPAFSLGFIVDIYVSKVTFIQQMSGWSYGQMEGYTTRSDTTGSKLKTIN